MQFLDVSCGLGDTFNEVILPRDVAIYGGLCALATYDRSEIKARTVIFLFNSFSICYSNMIYNTVIVLQCGSKES